MKRLPIGILGSGRGSNCRAILERIRSGDLAAEARVVISDVLDAPILDIAREFSVANAYLPPGQFRTRLEPDAENELVHMLRDAGAISSCSLGLCACYMHRCSKLSRGVSSISLH